MPGERLTIDAAKITLEMTLPDGKTLGQKAYIAWTPNSELLAVTTDDVLRHLSSELEELGRTDLFAVYGTEG